MIKIYSIYDKEFQRFGKVIDCPFAAHFDEETGKLPLPETGTSYQPAIPALESAEAKAYYRRYFGDMDVQIGCCWGRNDKLNGLEWHKSSELNYATCDMILILGDQREMVGDTFDTKHARAFFVKKGEMVEIYQTTLHLAPCMTENQVFRTVVILPKGTNTPLETPGADKKLVLKNKWLIIHPDFKRGVDMGRAIGLLGENICVND